MLIFNVPHLAAVMRDLTYLNAKMQAARETGQGGMLVSQVPDMDELLEAVGQVIGDLPLNEAIKDSVIRLREWAKNDPTMTIDQMSVLLMQSQNNVLLDMTKTLFLAVPHDQATRYAEANRKPPFGPEVQKRFSGAQRDIAAAARCYALDEWDAAVYHLMMVAGHGLRGLAIELQIERAATFEYQEWGKVIDDIEKKIDGMKLGQRTPDKAKKLEFYSKVTTQSARFKDAWRSSRHR